jgi:hypothetical protein
VISAIPVNPDPQPIKVYYGNSIEFNPDYLEQIIRDSVEITPIEFFRVVRPIDAVVKEFGAFPNAFKFYRQKNARNGFYFFRVKNLGDIKPVYFFYY